MTRLLPILVSLLCLYLPVLEAQTVYMKPAEALKVIFKDSKEIVSEKKLLSEVEIAAAEKKFGGRLPKKEWNIFVAKTDGRVDGYALIDNEVGKTEPITFLTAITPAGGVKSVEILVYREPIGSEVHDRRFLKQFEGKRSSDPVRPGQDIANISGATLSARAVSLGVKRALAVWEVLYGK